MVLSIPKMLSTYKVVAIKLNVVHLQSCGYQIQYLQDLCLIKCLTTNCQVIGTISWELVTVIQQSLIVCMYATY